MRCIPYRDYKVDSAVSKEFYLKQKYEIIGIEQSEKITVNYQFTVKEDDFDIQIVISENLKEIEAKTRYEISEDLQQTIQSHLILNESYIEGRQDQINESTANAQRNLIKAVHKLVDLMEFETGYLFLNENLRQGNCYCSLDGECWEDIKKREFTSHFEVSWKNIPGLNESEKTALQCHIDKNVEPFLATHHLFKAIKETDPRHQLINLALALELGIKEYLVRKKTDTEVAVLIKNVPSPPLVKLYGEVLECFAGEQTSVKKRIIGELAEDRNNLVHKVIKSVKSNLTHDIKDYILTTKIALFHLWLDLYPYDESMAVRYKRLLDANPRLIRNGYTFFPKSTP
jgi:hypothetical protein